MNKQEIFNEFKDEIESIKKQPCESPYPVSQYKDAKTKRVLRDIDINRNHSWIKEVWERRKSGLDDVAIFYRGTKFTFREFFTESYRYARAIKAQTDIQKGDEMICAIENTPEFPFLMGAASILGIKINLVSAEFDTDYLEHMLNRAECPYVFVSDMSFSKFSKAMENVNKPKTIIRIPLNHSLPNGINPYEEITEKYYKLDEKKYEEAIAKTKSIDIGEFLKGAELPIEGPIMVDADLNDEFTITYTSGSTGWGKPKGLIHRVRSYITMSRYHDPDISGLPAMKDRTTLALIKTMSDTDFMSSVSDTLMQGGTVALEPINDKEFFLTSMTINKPTLALAPRSYWIYAMKQYKFNKEYQNITLPSLLVPMAVGEPMAANEEKALNKWLKEIKAGIDVTKLPFSVVQMSIAGGDSEHGGIFLKIFRNLQSKRPSHRGIDEPIGMGTYDMVEVKALRPDGTYCEPMEPGRLVATSPCNMKAYVENDAANEKWYIKDAYGKVWGDLGVHGYIDAKGNVYEKGRLKALEGEIPDYKIQDVILKDTKKIMSCEVVSIELNGETIYIAHIEPQMSVSFNEIKVLESAMARCNIAFGRELVDRLYFRLHTNVEGFELLHTGKRNNIVLEQEGISALCIKASDLHVVEEPKKFQITKK